MVVKASPMRPEEAGKIGGQLIKAKPSDRRLHSRHSYK